MSSNGFETAAAPCSACIKLEETEPASAQDPQQDNMPSDQAAAARVRPSEHRTWCISICVTIVSKFWRYSFRSRCASAAAVAPASAAAFCALLLVPGKITPSFVPAFVTSAAAASEALEIAALSSV